MTMKSKLLLLDANIVLELLRLDIWDEFLERCDVSLAEAVVSEVHTTPVPHGIGHEIDLHLFASAGKLSIVATPISQANEFLVQFGREYADKLDPGELESLAMLCTSEHVGDQICSADAIVYRTLGLLDRREQAISLESILRSIGLTQRLAHQYCEPFMEKHLSQGFRDRLEGHGFKAKGK